MAPLEWRGTQQHHHSVWHLWQWSSELVVVGLWWQPTQLPIHQRLRSFRLVSSVVHTTTSLWMLLEKPQMVKIPQWVADKCKWLSVEVRFLLPTVCTGNQLDSYIATLLHRYTNPSWSQSWSHCRQHKYQSIMAVAKSECVHMCWPNYSLLQ